MKAKSYINTITDKIFATLTLILTTIIAVGGSLGISCMLEYNIYEDNGAYAWQTALRLVTQTRLEEIEQEYYQYLLNNYVYGEPLPALGMGYDENKEPLISEKVIKKYAADECNFFFIVRESTAEENEANNNRGAVLWTNNALSGTEDDPQSLTPFHGVLRTQYNPTKGCTYYMSDGQPVTVTIEVFVLENSSWQARDGYSTAYWWINFANTLRFAVFAVVAIAVALIFAMLTIITVSAGRTDENGEIIPGLIDRVPLDIVTAVAIGMCAAAGICMSLTDVANAGIVMYNTVVIIAASVIMVVIQSYLETLSVRVKMGRIFKNTLINRVITIIARKTPRRVRTKYRNLSTFTKLIITVVSGTLLSLAVIIYFAYRYFILGDIRFEYYLFIWLVYRMISVPLLIMFALNFSYIKDAGQKIASGDLTSEDITSQLSIKQFRSHGQNLDHIKRDMSRAIEQEMKSERFRNELIANISHDIKTPLTAITSYVDHLQSDSLTAEQREEYTQVLVRQSNKLKLLLGDLVEISKVSTGNVTVNLEPMDIGVVVEQLAGEYDTRFQEHGLKLTFDKEDREYIVMADGKMLGRVLENLMTNIFKYAMEDTRVFIRVLEKRDRIAVVFRNIAKEIPGVEGKELFERFVRADSSRHTEGSGLGLPIAKSLAELQHATLSLDIEDDIFRTVLEFESCAPEGATQIFDKDQ